MSPIPIFSIITKNINEEWERKISYNKNVKKNSETNNFETRLLALKIGKTTENFKNIPRIGYLNFSIIYNSSILNNSFYNSTFNIQNHSDSSNSTFCDTKSLINAQNSNPNPLSIIEQPKEYKFNSVKTNFYLKNNLYDIKLYEVYNDFNIPTKYIINSEFYAFLYPCEIRTYSIVISGYLKTEKIKIEPNIPEIKESKFN